MSLRVSQNISANSAHRWMQVNDSAMAKSIERLSSGYRINSAADDAAGLVISEGLRTKVSGLTVAEQNTQNGVNMFKTAEKALDEIEVQLRNIRDLTLHAASQNSNTSAKVADQAQVDQALSAIDRIAEQTEFAGMKLFQDSGANSVNGKFFQIGSDKQQNVTFSLTNKSFGSATTLTSDMHSDSLLGITANGADLAHVYGAGAMAAAVNGNTEQFTLDWKHPDDTHTSVSFNIAGNTSTYTANTAGATAYVAAINTALKAQAYTTAGDATVAKLGDVFEAYVSDATGVENTTTGDRIGFRLKDVYSNQSEKSTSSSITVTSEVLTAGAPAASAGSGFAVGRAANTDAGDSGTTTLDISTLTTTTDYDAVIQQLDTALDKVNGLRVNLGAFQKNNLESNLNSLSVAKENLSASESAIRDTDMADEMVGFTRAQILTQAAQSMMTQANQAPQNILQMLR